MKAINKLVEDEIFNLSFGCSTSLAGEPTRKDIRNAISGYKKIASIAMYMAGILELTADTEIEIPY